MSAKRTHSVFRHTTRIALACAVVGACNEITPPTGESLSVCQMMGPTGMLVNIRESQLEEHIARGDYVANLLVSKGSTTGDGIHFARITDALAAARAGRIARGETTISACRITISVGAGTYTGSVSAPTGSDEALPLTIDVPDITLLGAFKMPVDNKGRPTGTAGAAASAPVTTIAASPGLISILTGNALDKYAEPLIVVNAHPDGPRGDGAVIQGFVLQSGNPETALVGGNAVWAMRARGIVVEGNQIEGGFSEPIEMRSGVGRVERNLLIGKGGSCAMCMFGPGDYRVIANRQISSSTNRLGLLIFPTIFTAVPPNVEQLVLPAEALVTAFVENNELRNHQEVPFGIGVRVAAIGPGAPNVAGMAKVTAGNNDLSDNRWAFVIEGGFVVANTAQRGSVDVTLSDNELGRSCQAGLLIALSSQGSAIAASPGLSLKNSSFTVTLGQDISWGDVWYSHPSGAGNTLMVDAKAIESGKRVPYDAKGC